MKIRDIIILLAILSFAGCSTSRKPASQSEVKVSTDQRSKLLPDRAMLGQWVSDTTRYFIGPNRIVWRYDSTGVRKSFPYKIIEVNDNKKTVRLEKLSIVDGDSSADLHDYLIFTFGNDNNSFEQVEDIGNAHISPIKFTYVDAMQEP